MRSRRHWEQHENDQYFRANGRSGDFALDLEFRTTTRAMEGKRGAAAISALNSRVTMAFLGTSSYRSF
jgi:hypothetical protein